MAFVANDRIKHPFDLLQVAKVLTLGTTGCITNWAAQVAVVTNFDQREAGMLFVIGAQTAIVRAAPLYRRVVNQGHLRRFYEDFTAAPVIINIISNQDTFVPVLGAAFQHEDLSILKHSFAFDLLKARGADGYDYIIEKIRTCFLRHMGCVL
jgi:hypothetical protein